MWDMIGETCCPSTWDEEPTTLSIGAVYSSPVSQTITLSLPQIRLPRHRLHPPSGPFSLDAINAATEQLLGYPIFSYWHFFNEADAGKILDDHVFPPCPSKFRNLQLTTRSKPASIRSLKYASTPHFFKTTMCPPSALRTHLLTSTTTPLAPCATPSSIATSESILSPLTAATPPH